MNEKQLKNFYIISLCSMLAGLIGYLVLSYYSFQDNTTPSIAHDVSLVVLIAGTFFNFCSMVWRPNYNK